MARTYSLFWPYEDGRRTEIRDDAMGGVVQLETTARFTGLQDTTVENEYYRQQAAQGVSQ